MQVRDLFDIIKSAENHPIDAIMIELRDYITKYSNKINTKDSAGRTACHYAVNKFPLLEILVLEGAAIIPENLTDDPTLNLWITELRNEQTRKSNKYRFLHLNDLICKGADINLIRNHCKFHREHIHETTYWKRNPCHWAALHNRADCIELLAIAGAKLEERDLDGKTPHELATSTETKDKIADLITSRSIANNKRLSTLRRETTPKKTEENPEGILTRFMRTVSPPKRSPGQTENNRGAKSPPRNANVYHPHAELTSRVSPRDRITTSPKAKRPTSPVLRRIITLEEETVARPAAGRIRSMSGGDIPRLEPIIQPRTRTNSQSVSPKQIRFRNDSSGPLSSSSPERADPDESAQLIFLIKNKDFKKFKEYYLQKKLRPNHVILGFGRPLLIQAFLSNADEIFIYLLRCGASLDVRTKASNASQTGRTFIDYIFEDNTKERINFLEKILKSINENLTQKSIAHYQSSLNEVTKKLSKLLELRGISTVVKYKYKELPEEIFKDIAKKNDHPVELVKSLYNLCSNLVEDNVQTFDSNLIKTCTIGLLVHTSQALMTILNDLYIHFGTHQKLRAIYIVNEMILNDSFQRCYRKKFFCDKTFPEFLAQLRSNDLAELADLLHEILELQYKINYPLVLAKSKIEAILIRSENNNPPLSDQDPRAIADELRKLTAQFWRTLKITELVNLNWTKKNKLDDAPNVVKQSEFFNKISQYFLRKILLRITEKEKLASIKMYMRTLHELIHGDPCDLYSAMALLGTLECKLLNPYIQKLSASKSKTMDEYNNNKELLGFFPGNYPGHRKLMEHENRLVLPWLGILSKDCTFNNELPAFSLHKAKMEGKLFEYIIELQKRISYEFALPSTNFAYQLQCRKEFPDNHLEYLAMASDPKPIRLISMDLLLLREIMEIFIECHLPLKVIYEGKQYEETEAVHVVFSHIKETILLNGLSNLNDLNKLIKKVEVLQGATEQIKALSKDLFIWLKAQSFCNPKLLELREQFESIPAEEFKEPLQTGLKM